MAGFIVVDEDAPGEDCAFLAAVPLLLGMVVEWAPSKGKLL
jgi:hypothetical protein